MTQASSSSSGAAAPGCPHAPSCPGCPWINAPYEEGLAAKGDKLARALARYPELGVLAFAPVVGAERITEYRMRAKLVVSARGRLGLYGSDSHDVVDIPECRVLAPELARVAAGIRASLPLPIAVSAVDLRLCDRGVLACLVVDGRPASTQLALAREQVQRRVPGLAGLAVSFRAPGAVQLLGNEHQVLDGNEAEPHHLTPRAPWHYASHGAFTQVHAGQASRLHTEIERAIAARLGGIAGRRVLELYAGSGALGLRLAAAGADVVSVESYAPAAQRLESAARAQGLRVAARAMEAEAFLAESAKTGAERFDVILVNPPRRGLSPAVRAGIAALGPRLIGYVSCEPETLARDLSHLALLGWGTSELTALDMIPLSDAVECLCVLEPRPPPPPRVLYEDEKSIALFKLPFEPTTPQGESSISLLTRARHGLGLPELTPIHRLDAGTSGVCWFARRPNDVAELADALTRGEKTYVALAHGVTHERGKIKVPIAEGDKLREAVTRFRRRRVVTGHSLLELLPEHARKHQLRRHLAAIGHGILGDARQGHSAANRHFAHRHGLDRPFLHCSRLRLELSAGPVEICAELAGDLAAVLTSLESSQVGLTSRGAGGRGPRTRRRQPRPR